jgi:hypothetical protein
MRLLKIKNESFRKKATELSALPRSQLSGSASGLQSNSGIASSWETDSGTDPDNDNAVSTTLGGLQSKASGSAGG